MKKKILVISLILLFNFIFIDFVFADTYNNYVSATVSCGGKLVEKIPSAVPKTISIFYNVIQVGVPILLVILGTIDLTKSMTANKEDEIKKGRQIFIKRLISGVLVFFVFIVVKFFISLVADDNKSDTKSVRIMQCAECFISNDENCIQEK